MGRSIAAWIALLMVASIVVACDAFTDDNANGGIGGTSWTVVSINGAPTAPNARPTMVFEFDGSLSGSGGCNQYSGSFRTDGDRITVRDLSSTMMACEAPLMAQEQGFLAALGGATTWRLTEQGNLQLEGAGDIEAEPAAAP
jgi:heat shock protein HslJ